MGIVKRSAVILTLLAGLAVISGWLFRVHDAPSLARPVADKEASLADRGAAAFEGAAFGGLSMAAMESHALPWRLSASALVLDEIEHDPKAALSQQTLDSVLARFGFLVDATPVNRPASLTGVETNLPLGMTYGELAPVGGSTLLSANLGCAACHAGVTYDAGGDPQPQNAWLGMPNTSINLEAYVLAVFNAMRNQVGDHEKLLAAARTIFPDMGWREAMTLRWIVLPIVDDRLAALSEKGRPLPFPNGVPGSTNGVAALKFRFGLPLLGGGEADNGIVSVPDLGHRVWRSSLLVDGAYAPVDEPRQRPLSSQDVNGGHLQALADITSFFTVPSMGVHPDAALTHRDDATAIFAFMADVYAPQAFPASINEASAVRGAAVYEAECAECHGTYQWRDSKPSLTMFPNWLGDVGTDPLRAAAFTEELANAISQTSYEGLISATRTTQYAAPPLSGIWASAPYLHNGSVPSIDALLTPEQRPARFMVGGHALDFETLGIALTEEGAYRADYEPFSQPVWYDTQPPGQGNQGHHFGTALSASDKRDLIEFLKLL